jgi:hypothetical protein
VADADIVSVSRAAVGCTASPQLAPNRDNHPKPQPAEWHAAPDDMLFTSGAKAVGLSHFSLMRSLIQSDHAITLESVRQRSQAAIKI